MPNKNILKKHGPLLVENALTESGVKGMISLTKDALVQAPAWMRGIIYVAGIGAVLCVVVSVVFIFMNESQRGFSTLLCGFGVLGMAIIALVIILLNRTAESFSEEIMPQRASGPVWEHFEKQIGDRGQQDFAVHSFFCPDLVPTSISKLGIFCLLNMWADPRGSSVTVTLVDVDQPPYLDIQFFNSDKGWPCAVSIRPSGLKPYQREKGFNFLCLEAKIIPPARKDHMDRVAIRFRILDRLGTDWYHGRGENDYLTECVKADPVPDRWTAITIPLTDGHWKVFPAYGNHCYPKSQPDFDEMILALVVELGSDRGNERPGPGKGRILLRNIHFSER